MFSRETDQLNKSETMSEEKALSPSDLITSYCVAKIKNEQKSELSAYEQWVLEKVNAINTMKDGSEKQSNQLGFQIAFTHFGQKLLKNKLDQSEVTKWISERNHKIDSIEDAEKQTNERIALAYIVRNLP